ncbi:unnamed protein product [Pieris macdunnoughi]|uniref:Aminopeptidase n=1 Tax=Pieris macdunnoughi TaxID=345717 RepID=A0A821RZS7_9NEOP|nr:unnamed protein product [Pieris macdunnoughi]
MLKKTFVFAFKKIYRQNISCKQGFLYSRSISSSFCEKIMETSKIKLSERLSPLIHPVNYKLKLNPDLESGKFLGEVSINVIVDGERDNFSLHTKFLHIKDVKVTSGHNEITVQKYFEIKSLEQLYIQFDKNIHVGSYDINIEFSGDLTRNIVGFYLSRLKAGGSMVASKFQPTYARQAFPCFDEPDFKATYDITLVKPIDYVALSNMNEISKTVDKSTKTETVTFATSVPMSTYLACFVVCNFDYKETLINASGIGKDFTLRSFAQKQQTHKIDFAQDIGKRATEFYIKYYEVPYPLPKLDMIAIPDYVSGATEHWGLITYRETSFLVNEATTSSQNKISVANTIAHELAHMWFGNLVTMKWWDEVWLNEGFASYMQVKSLNAIEPSWTMLDQFLTKTLHSVLVTDAKLSSHPIVQTVETPDQITAIFDSISYNKGASILRMLEGFIGEENFRRGVSDYLKKYKYGNTVTQELLSSLEPYFKTLYPHLSLKYIMDTWTRQMGYPLITVRPGANNIYILTQSRFLLDPAATYDDDSEFHYRWYVPITYSTSTEKRDDILWFADTSDSVEISLSDDEKLLKINNNQVGYYRVNYPLDMWSQIIEQLKVKSNMLTISDRAHLLDDAFALADAGILPYNIALSLTQYLPVEKDYVPWETASGKFSHLSNKLINTPAYENLKKYVQHLIAGLYTEQSWEKTNLDVIQGCWAKSKALIKGDSWLGSAAESDIASSRGLPDVTSAEYLNLAWDEKNIRSQDYLNVLQLISANPSGNGLVWDEVRNRWNTLVDRFTLNSRYLGNLIPAITSRFNTEKQLQEMISFFEKNSEAGAGASARQRALENVRNNIKWTSSHQSTVTSWLENYVKAIISI